MTDAISNSCSSSQRNALTHRGAFFVHILHRVQVVGRPSQFSDLPVELLVGDVIGRRGISREAFPFQIVLLPLVSPHVERAVGQQLVRSRHDGAEYSVQSAQHERLKEHDAQPQREGPQQREEVDGFAPGHRLPNAVGDIEQSAESGDRRGDAGHVTAQRHHVVVEHPQQGVHVVGNRKR